MKKIIILLITLTSNLLYSSEFTISSYNAGSLSGHYDYMRAASMQKLIQERFNAESEDLSLNEKIQKLALKIKFTEDPEEKALAEQEWDLKGYQQLFEKLTLLPTDPNSKNAHWFQKHQAIISDYRVRPIIIFDNEVERMLNEHLENLCFGQSLNRNQLLHEVRSKMAKHIFTYHMKHDIICLQEADNLNASMFPDHYEVLFGKNDHSVNGVAWNKDRFELVNAIGDIGGNSAYAVCLLDKENGKKVLVASGHIKGCNPFRVAIDPITGKADSALGDKQIYSITKVFDQYQADLKLIGMDLNVTSLHPRMDILKNNGYRLDYEHYIDPSCSDPTVILYTRIDWIMLKSNNISEAKVTNLPVLNVGLNSIQTNVSDHKPIAAKIHY